MEYLFQHRKPVTAAQRLEKIPSGISVTIQKSLEKIPSGISATTHETCYSSIVGCFQKSLEKIPSGISVPTQELQVFCCVEDDGSDDFILEIFKLSRINNVEIYCQQNNVQKHLKKRIIGFQYNDIRMTLHKNTENLLLLINQRFYTFAFIHVRYSVIQQFHNH